MKQIKLHTVILFILLFIVSYPLFSQGEDPPCGNAGPEVWITNWTGSNISVDIYPVSMVFKTVTHGELYKYDLTARVSTPSEHSKFIGATNDIRKGSPFIVKPTALYRLLGLAYDFQTNQSPTDCDSGIVGLGIYKFEIKDNQGGLIDTFWVEWDFGHATDFTWHECRGYDIYFDVYSNRVEFKWAGSTCSTYTSIFVDVNHSLVNRRIEAWRQPRWNPNTQQVEIISRAKNIGNGYLKYDRSNSMPIMQDSRRDCIIQNPYHDERQSFTSELSGMLSLSLSIQTDVTTLESFCINPNDNPPCTQFFARGITVLSNALLEIYNSKILTLRNYSNTTDAATMTIKGDPNYTVPTIGLASLILRPSSELKVQSNSTLIFEKYSTIYLDNNSKIWLQPGARFTNKGAIIGGKGQIIGETGPGSDEIVGEDTLIFRDSVNVVLQDSAKWNIARNSVILFDGPKAKLVCNPQSAINFGKNSKMIFKNGASIYANNSKFTSSDADSTWDGIYLSDLAYDTIKNCVIENAYNGINIEDKTHLFSAVFATEISNCTFRNTTSTDLLNYVYVNNSSNVLIKDCSSQVSSSGKFTSGILTEYCPSNGVIIVDNDIGNVTTGINIVQSSLYIGRNTITGSTNSGTGIYLDNSNGTIEYNIVNNFQKSLNASYSSPYLLKNTFSGASSKNIDLTSNSMPIMKPVVSGSTLRWLGGNNNITGTPSACGIAFADCYPLMDSGYNRVIVNGADYLNGTFFYQYTTVLARLNWWYDDPPQSSLFDITGGDVTYSPTFDGSSVPATDGSELNSLGWGLYDTVFTKDLGDTPSAEDIFMQAYTSEMQSEFEDAIDLYKQVVSDYKTSSFAPVSLSRIFNCMEKYHSTALEYQAVQGYYSNINSDTTYSTGVRELSEDFAIKSKVKQGLIENAIIDYDNIYSQNQNNSKGHHALINKLCLMNMSQGGDNLLGGNSSNTKHKYELLSLIIGKDIERRTQEVTQNIPKQFKLYQNYPNPFNPVTTIKYDIPKDGNVTIIIYDITGKEVFAINEYKPAGSYSVTFDGTNFASGLYLYKIESGNFLETKKMVLVK